MMSSDYYQTYAPMRSIPDEQTRYVVVCRGPNCRERGGLELRKRLVALVRGRASPRLLGYACFGQCDHGPNVVFFPDDAWRGQLRAADAEALLERDVDSLPGQDLEPPEAERREHLANIAELVATVERDTARRQRARRWWWPF